MRRDASAAGLTRWLDGLEARYLGDLTLPEVARALRALSSAYVERRTRATLARTLDGAGKRAAFALFYGPLHALLVDAVVRALPDATGGLDTILDLGCGTGAAGATWAAASDPPARLEGIDRHPWALGEARWTWRMLGLSGRVQSGDIVRAPWPPRPSGILAAFAVNELAPMDRDRLRARLLAASAAGSKVLVVEPLARAAAPWWNEWRRAFEAAGGRADEWRIPANLPPLIERLDRAAGLRHDEITGRTLYIDS